MHKQLMIGLQGLKLTQQERLWLQERPPLGVILFARNLDSPEQVKALLADVRACTGQPTWAAIDEEGGRVYRLPWPPFTGRKHAAEYGLVYQENAESAISMVFDDAFLVGKALKDLGFTHNCAPILDLFFSEGHSIIGKRAYGADADTVVNLASACMRGLAAAGIEAVGKHFPGHGRANADSHVAVPVVDADLEVLLREAHVFQAMSEQGLQHIMTAHVIYSQVESQVATFSPFWLQDILRKKFLFEGAIWSDDLCMQGAGGAVKQAALAAQDAGCDVLLVCEPEGVAAVYA